MDEFKPQEVLFFVASENQSVGSIFVGGSLRATPDVALSHVDGNVVLTFKEPGVQDILRKLSENVQFLEVTLCDNFIDVKSVLSRSPVFAMAGKDNELIIATIVGETKLAFMNAEEYATVAHR